jgi:hypothetical protein
LSTPSPAISYSLPAVFQLEEIQIAATMDRAILKILLDHRPSKLRSFASPVLCLLRDISLEFFQRE